MSNGRLQALAKGPAERGDTNTVLVSARLLATLRWTNTPIKLVCRPAAAATGHTLRPDLKPAPTQADDEQIVPQRRQAVCPASSSSEKTPRLPLKANRFPFHRRVFAGTTSCLAGGRQAILLYIC